MSARDRLLDLFLHGGNGSQPEFEAALDAFEAEQQPAEQSVNEALVKARETAAAMFEVEAGERRPLWRVIYTDSESATGVALVCTAEGVGDEHRMIVTDDGSGEPMRDDQGVYDCCPGTQFETYSTVLAAYLVELLNADAEAGEQS